MKQRVTIVLLHAPFDLYGQLQYLILKLYLFIIDKKCLVHNPCSFEDSCFYTFKVICQPLWYQADTSSSIKYQVEPSFTSCKNVKYQVFIWTVMKCNLSIYSCVYFSTCQVIHTRLEYKYNAHRVKLFSKLVVVVTISNYC